MTNIKSYFSYKLFFIFYFVIVTFVTRLSQVKGPTDKTNQGSQCVIKLV